MSPVCLYSKEDVISNMPKMILMTLIIIIMIIWHFHFWYGKGICLQCNLFFFIIICFDRCRIQTLRKCWQTWIAVNCFGYLVDSWRSPWRRRVRILGKSLASSRAGNLVTVSAVKHLYTGEMKPSFPHVFTLLWKRHQTRGLLRMCFVVGVGLCSSICGCFCNFPL